MGSGTTASTTASSGSEVDPLTKAIRSIHSMIGFPATRIAVVGSRAHPDEEIVRHIIGSVIQPWHVLVSGGAPGVDTWAEETVRGLYGDEAICVHYPDYEKYSPKVAPLKRNTLIAHDSDLLLAFWDGKSRGTIDVLEKAKALGKVVIVVLPDFRVLSNYGKVDT